MNQLLTTLGALAAFALTLSPQTAGAEVEHAQLAGPALEPLLRARADYEPAPVRVLLSAPSSRLFDADDGPTLPNGPAPTPVRDEPATLFGGDGDYALGGFGGIGIMYTRFAGHDAPMVCGEGALLIDHALSLGGGGCGITRTFRAASYARDAYTADERIVFGYGGGIVRYHFLSRSAVNLSLGTLVGAGTISIGSVRDDEIDDGYGESEFDFAPDRHDTLLVVEPQVGLHANLTRWLRVGMAAGYRIAGGVDAQGLSDSDASGLTLGGQIQGGWL
jgi:hypothetical protein